MIETALLEKLGFESEDIEYILCCDKKYGEKIAPVSQLFMEHEKDADTRKTLSDQMLRRAVETAGECDNVYILQLLFWLYCVPFAKTYYDQNNIAESIFYDTMKDLSCKTRECKRVKGKTGVYYPWFYLHFSFVYFSLGRLQFCIENYQHDTYSKGDFVIKKGDRIYSCHIPSGEKLTEEKCMDSFQNAYEFFKPELESDILPVICTSWLLYPPYIERVFPKGSNIERFAKLFHITGQYEKGRIFSECEQIFGMPFQENTEALPCDNSLRRNMIEYMNSQSLSGHGIGILLYDGRKKEIVK